MTETELVGAVGVVMALLAVWAFAPPSKWCVVEIAGGRTSSPERVFLVRLKKAAYWESALRAPGVPRPGDDHPTALGYSVAELSGFLSDDGGTVRVVCRYGATP